MCSGVFRALRWSMCYLQLLCFHSLCFQPPDFPLQTLQILLKVTAWRQDKHYSLIPFHTSAPSLHMFACTSLLLGPKIHVCTHSKLRGAETDLDRVSGAYSLSAVRWMIFLLWSLILSASFSLVCLEWSRGRDNGLQWGSCELLSQWTMMLNDNDTAIITQPLSGCKSSDAPQTLSILHKFIYWFQQKPYM